MIFNSIDFLFIYLPVTLAVFLILRRTISLNITMLLLVVFSLVFYGWNVPELVLLIISSTFGNFAISAALQRSHCNSTRKIFFIFGIICNLLLLGYFKYAGFFLAIVCDVTGKTYSPLNIILPIGISFYTFQQIAFLVDRYRSEADHPSLVRYCLFVTFFPQLVAGPIVNHKEMMPQFSGNLMSNGTIGNISRGLALIIFGLAKKVILADGCAPVADAAFAAGHVPGIAEAWLGALAFGLQIYFDFSGYTDIALGAALCFGISLPQNFASPYRATSIIDFWRRWHITLSRFLRDYLYIPLGGRHRGRYRLSRTY